MGHLVEKALAQVSGFIAAGNTLVYGELAPVFVRFAEWLETDDVKDPNLDVDTDIDSICHRLVPDRIQHWSRVTPHVGPVLGQRLLVFGADASGSRSRSSDRGHRGGDE